MAPKSLRIAYWTATGVFALLLVLDGLGGITRAEAGVEALTHLGYPLYLLPTFGHREAAGGRRDPADQISHAERVGVCRLGVHLHRRVRVACGGR